MLSLRLTLVPFLLLGSMGCSNSSGAKQADAKGDPQPVAVALKSFPPGPAQAAKQQDEKPKEDLFTSKQHGFSVAFPGKAEESNRQVRGQQLSEFLNYVEPRQLFLVAVSAAEIKAEDIPGLTPNGSRVVSLKRVTANKLAGAEIVTGPSAETVATAYSRYRTFKTERRTYIVGCLGESKDSVSGERAQRFFDSFSVLDDPSGK